MFTEGQPMKISMKLRKNPRVDEPQHIIFSSNLYATYGGDQSGAVESRLSIYTFYKMDEEIRRVDCMAHIRDHEAASVLLYCNEIYLTRK